MLKFQGVVRDADGFTLADLVDGRTVVYRGREDGSYRFIVDSYGFGPDFVISGYTASDIIIYTFAMLGPSQGWPEGLTLKMTALHEFGHLIGLAHIKTDPRAVMSPSLSDRGIKPALTRADI